MSSKKVLIVTYYWPPSGGSGVQRWLKFVKYLDKAGWETFVVTPENPSFTIADPSLAKDIPANTEVLKLPIWEPYNAFFRLSGIFGKTKPGATDMISAGKKGLFQKISSWVRGNFFIPDPRIFWVKPASTFIGDIIKSNQIDTIITTGPPHSIHLIGLRLKKKNPELKWIADFRDPWSEWDLLDTLSLSSIARRRHAGLEKKVLQTANEVITIAPYHVKRFEALGGRKVNLITNGFDADDFQSVERKQTEKLTIRHTGVVDELRDPRPFMVALKAAFEKSDSMRKHVAVEFIGTVNAAFKEFVKSDEVLKTVVTFVDNIPHKQLLKLYGETDLLLLILAHTAIAPGNLPGKFFEYLASGLPIIAIGPVDGDAAHIMKESGAGRIFERTQVEDLTDELLTRYHDWQAEIRNYTTGAAKFTRESLTRELISLLEKP
jgi:glycosyltransferase involved in cell wall biosynthesis